MFTTPSVSSMHGIQDMHLHKEVERVSQDLEAAFLAEMLKNSGLGKTENSFSGSSGESQFSSLLTAEYSQKISQSGGIGLSESFIKSMISGKN